MHKLYESFTGSGTDPAVYRELILTDTEESSRMVKGARHPTSCWAVMFARFPSVPPQEVESVDPEIAQSLQVLLGWSPENRSHRYDRVIILRRGEQDQIDSLVSFLRAHMPWLIPERRLFVASWQESGELEPFEQIALAVGMAIPCE